MSVIQTARASQITAHEASICDRLGSQPHPNIAEYLGVQVSDKLNCAVGLVFKRYDCTLRELVTRRQKFDMRLCLQFVFVAIQYLHKLGIVYGDLKPHNIFVKRGAKDHSVIEDFDSAHDTGSVITLKTGDPRWSRRKRVGEDVAEEDDDWSRFRKLTEWLVGERGGETGGLQGYWEDSEDIIILNTRNRVMEYL
ncbi:hypothetical protein BU25DRAFT_387585 [Macroventuria anomochaeta]|uniref:Uncharacterized protein n=1 Tax=Macroventuria anomochaeta TaxID=301207 RepID=A0ACB6S806_9PLEO|nr:uncharacterized protein BU25DRAFT_387585 [Macroventuria anomochaeta]KAF2630405.1 hypothetical protein BU25DRAFT_387585 [Macroventuria anomochaeta]